MRRLLALATVAFPISLIVFAHGCSSGEPPVEDLCGWLGDPGNCYRGFFDDIGARCGGGTTTGSALKGSFLSSDKLDTCIITEGEGGTVSLDAAITPASFPLTALGFSRTLADGTSCGTFTIAGPNSFSIMVEPYPPDAGVPVTTSSTSGAGGGNGAGGGSGTGGSGTGGSGTGGGSGDDGVISGGTFSITPTDQRDTADTSCPGGETHHFNTLQAEKCPALATLMPRAEIESKAPTYDVKGFIRVRIYHPPTEGYPDTGITPAKDANGQTVPIQPSFVEYFDCEIPPVTKPCQNGIQDGAETGIDCGGPTGPAGADPGIFCPRCGGNQSCLTDTDCFGGAKCVIDPMTGSKGCEDLCVNGVLDTAIGETDVDCGGTTCSSRCDKNQFCKENSDCSGANICWDGACSDICNNMTKNPDTGETDKDCGGALCPNRCGDGLDCIQDSDCLPNRTCKESKCNNPCSDKVQSANVGETDVDCGGDICTARCAQGQMCKKNSDCTNGLFCKGGTCNP